MEDDLNVFEKILTLAFKVGPKAGSQGCVERLGHKFESEGWLSRLVSRLWYQGYVSRLGSKVRYQEWSLEGFGSKAG